MMPFSKGYIRAGLNSVLSAKLRSFWTMLGVIIGVASVITVVAIGQGIKEQVGGQLHRLGNDLITVRPAQIGGDNGLQSLSGLNITSSLTAKDVAAVSTTKGVGASAPLTITTGRLSADGMRVDQGVVIGTTPDLASLIDQQVGFGSFLTDDDMGANAAVLGSKLALNLFDEDIPLGRSFTFQGREFIVRGIFNDFNATPLSQQASFDDAVFIPNDVAESLSKNTAPTYEILARPAKNTSVDQAVANIKSSLDKVHGGQDNFAVLKGNESLASSNTILDLLTKLIAGVAAISLLVGGIGIMNVMLVSVAERTKEIGIRKAIGASNRQILSQFIVEASILSLVGGIIGIIIALIIDGLLRVFTDLRPIISWEVALLATVISLAVGIIFGSFPALKAARKDPIDALRSQ